MQSNVHASSGTQCLGEIASIRLRVDHFDLVTRMIGYTTWQAKAAFIGVDPATLSRARQDNAKVTDRLIAATLAALGRHREWFADKNTPITFDALFEVTCADGERQPTGEVVAA